MLETKKYKKEIKAIVKDTNGIQFIVWKKNIFNIINQMSFSQIENELYRYKIKLELLKNDDNSETKWMVGVIIQIVISLITITISILGACVSNYYNGLASYAQESKEKMQYFYESMVPFFVDFNSSIIRIIVFYLIVLIVMLGGMTLYNIYKKKENYYKKIYYTNIICCLEEGKRKIIVLGR